MMGNHREATNVVGEQAGAGGGSGSTNATLSGATATIGVLSLILAIVSVAVPNWGDYYLGAQSFNDYSGHFGPFQTCRYYIGRISDCHGQTAFRPSTWIYVAGIVAIITVIAIGVFVLFSILHVAMQLQKRSIWLKDIKTALFLKLVSSSVAVLGCIIAVGLSSWEFEVARRKNTIFIKFGFCYYIQIVLIALNILLVGLSFMTYRKGEPSFTSGSASGGNAGYSHEVGLGGRLATQFQDTGGSIAITNASGSPYPHGQPQGMPPSNNHINAHSSGGVVLGYGPLPSTTTPQPLRTIQPVPKVATPKSSIPAYYDYSSSNPVGLNDYRGPGVSFTPGGSTKLVKKGAQEGSMESLNSTQSLTLSMGSTASAGSFHGPLKSSMKKPQPVKESGSVTSRGSGKHPKFAILGEQTSV